MRKDQYTSLTSALAKLSPVSPQCSCVQARSLQSEWMDNCMSKILDGFRLKEWTRRDFTKFSKNKCKVLVYILDETNPGNVTG